MAKFRERQTKKGPLTIEKEGKTYVDHLDEDKADEEDFDLDYSQTQLDDFLKSNMSSSMMKGTNI